QPQPHARRARLRALRARLGAARLALAARRPAAVHAPLHRLMAAIPLAPGGLGGRYPERDQPREGVLDRLLVATQYATGRLRSSRGRLERIVPATRESLPLGELRVRLRREGLTEELVGVAFAHVRATAERVLGKRHFDVQL